jgi:uncharacterized protein with NAD-binding domain and iron-sulfur cluster
MTDDRYTRRTFLRHAGAGAGLLTLSAIAPPQASARRGRRRPTVAVFGGGIAGLTAAHELAERGFDVTVYERRAWGGKARSTNVPGSARGGRKPLPGEHGARIVFGFEQNLPDTFRRIPFGSNRDGVFDNLVAAPEWVFARDRGRRNLSLPLGAADPRPYTPEKIADLLIGLLLQTNLPPDAVAYFAQRMVVFLSSCDARRYGQWENTTWTDFTAADRFPDDYRKIIVTTTSEFYQASTAERTSALFPAHALEWLIYNELGFGANGPPIRILDRPTNEALIDPWLTELNRLGVRLLNQHELTGFDLSHGRIRSARVHTPRGSSTIHADWYVCALPVERARRLWTPAILAADPSLERMWNLDTAWMNGLKFYLRENRPLANGHLYCTDSPWLIGSINQAQFWPVDFAATYGDGRAHDCLSVVISKWTAPGVLYGKPAQDCTPAEIAHEAWEQIKLHVNKPGQPPQLTDDLILTWSIDPGMIRRGDRLISDDPLVLPIVSQRADRPDVTTAVPNLLLAGDYLKSNWEVANMETASYNARRAVNALLDKAGSTVSPAAAIEPYRPPEWEPLKQIDEQRYAAGQPNIFDVNLTEDALKELLNRPATSLTGLLERVAASI